MLGQHRSLPQIPVGCPAPHKTHCCIGQECCSLLVVLHFALYRCLANQDKGVAANLNPTNWVSLLVLHKMCSLCPVLHLYISSCPGSINCSPEYVRGQVVVSCRGLLGQRRLYMYCETSETAAPVSSSITKGWPSIAIVLLMAHPATSTARTPRTSLPGLEPFLHASNCCTACCRLCPFPVATDPLWQTFLTCPFIPQLKLFASLNGHFHSKCDVLLQR